MIQTGKENSCASLQGAHDTSTFTEVILNITFYRYS